MKAKKASEAKPPAPKVSVGSLRVRFKKPAHAPIGPPELVAAASPWEDQDEPGLQVSFIDAQVTQMRQYARAADSQDDPELREIGMAGLRRLATRLLEADPAVRKLRAMGGDERMHQLVQYAKAAGYPPARGHLPRFVQAAAKRLDASERQVERWLAKAKKENLLP